MGVGKDLAVRVSWKLCGLLAVCCRVWGDYECRNLPITERNDFRWQLVKAIRQRPQQ